MNENIISDYLNMSDSFDEDTDDDEDFGFEVKKINYLFFSVYAYIIF